jgi:hypothetical protein
VRETIMLSGMDEDMSKDFLDGGIYLWLVDGYTLCYTICKFSRRMTSARNLGSGNMTCLRWRWMDGQADAKFKVYMYSCLERARTKMVEEDWCKIL